jgi:4-amino-4-deoxy-L-arabinose transferase-like glycosyltransferase
MGESGEQTEWIHRAGRWCGTWRAALVLIVMCVAVYLPGFVGIAAVDRDESRFAQASRQMLESSDWHGWLLPRVQDRPRLNKPPLIYWLQAGSAALFTQRWKVDGPTASRRDAIWMYRVPSLLGAIAMTLLTWRLGLAMFDARVGTLAAALVAVCPVMTWEAKQARADMVMVAATTAALWALWGLWSRRDRAGADWPRVVAMWVSVGIGVMTKGPVPLMIIALASISLAALAREWNWLLRLRAPIGVIVIGALLGPWVYLVARDVGFGAYWSIVWSETVGRSVEPKEGHWGPPGYHLVFMLVIFFPGSLLAALAVARAWRVGIARGSRSNSNHGVGVVRWVRSACSLRAGRPAECFLLAALVPSWLVFELIGTKLPHYTMPLYPVLALLCARAVLAGGAGNLRGLGSTLGRLGVRLWSGVAVAFVALASGVVYLAVPRSFGFVPKPAIVGVLILALLVTVFILDRAIRARKIVRVQLIGIAIAAAWTCIIGLALPVFEELQLSRRLAAHAAALDPHGTRPIGMLGYHEDSMIFETRGRATRLAPGEGAEWLSRSPTGLLVVDESVAHAVAGTRELARVSGFNYSKGRRVTVLLLERSP